MTLIYTPRHVDQLINEIATEWIQTNDPDMHRVADAFPLGVLEKAYLKKLDALTPLPESSSGRAETPAQKIHVMRRLCRAWLREPQLRIGQLIVAGTDLGDPQYSADDAFRQLYYQDDSALVIRMEKRYSHPK